MARVAASAGQLVVILHRDPGLMVELKRWIAKDATDHGQLIADPDLTDEAIFERLETDINFRGVATLLVQKYGYLQPTVNPESPLAKQQELLMQERAKWLAQDEESARASARQQQKLVQQQTQACDPQINSNCPAQAEGAHSSGQQLQGQPGINQVPTGVPGLETPQTNPPATNPYNAPQRTVPSNDITELLRTSGQDPLALEETQPGSAFGGQSAQLRSMLSDESGEGGGLPQRSNQGGQQNQGSALSGTGVDDLSLSSDFLDEDLSRSSSSTVAPAASYPSASSGTNGTGSSRYNNSINNSVARDNLLRARESTSQSQRMVRSPNPYDDIPSLYDMYLQAAARPPAVERFRYAGV